MAFLFDNRLVNIDGKQVYILLYILKCYSLVKSSNGRLILKVIALFVA